MQCENCNAVMKDGAKFCPQCGKAVEGTKNGAGTLRVGNSVGYGRKSVQVSGKWLDWTYHNQADRAEEATKFVSDLFASKGMKTTLIRKGTTTVIKGKTKFSLKERAINTQAEIKTEGQDLVVKVAGGNNSLYLQIAFGFLFLCLSPFWPILFRATLFAFLMFLLYWWPVISGINEEIKNYLAPA